MTRRGRFADFWFRTLSRSHALLLKLSRWRLATRSFHMPVVEVQTIGRRSGRPRLVTLSAVVIEGDRIVLVGSKGGDDRHPDWYRNLVANPHIEVTLHGSRRSMVARTADAEERAKLWPKVVAANRAYAAYQRRTHRQIPIIICEPAT
jgi:deazaflavin-dependent oxidoreductase (nitroreductase family)